MSYFLEGLLDPLWYQELLEAGKAMTNTDKAHLIPRLVITLDNDEAEFCAISHIVDGYPHFVWTLCVFQGFEPHLAYFDTRIFASWAENAGIPPWDNAFRWYRYVGEQTLQTLLSRVDEVVNYRSPPLWLTATLAPVGEDVALADDFEMIQERESKRNPAPLLTEPQINQMIENWRANRATDDTHDFFPVVKLHLPAARMVWLLTELNPEEPDIAFGLCDLGMGFPELGYVNLSELDGLRGPMEVRVVQDVAFVSDKSLSEYYRMASKVGRIVV